MRTGNLVAEFPELKNRPNVCTNPVCFGEKCKAHWVEKATDLKDKGKTVLTSGEFKKVSKEYISADRDGWGLFRDEYDSPAKVLGKHAPEPVMVAMPDGLKKFYKRTDIPEDAKKAKVLLAKDANEKTASPEEKAKLEAKEKENIELRAGRESFLISLAPRAAAALNKLKDASIWSLLAERLQGKPYLYSDFQKALFKGIKGDKGRVLFESMQQALKCVNDETGWDRDNLRFWKVLGIDLEKEFAAVEKAAQKSLPLAKDGPKQGKLLEVKKNKVKTKKKGAKK